MAFRLHNTLTKRVELFKPRESGKAAIYVCGPTVYDSTHLGHMRAAVVFDILRRYLEYRGYRVTHVQNITDVEDKIIQRALEEGVPADAIAERYSAEYRQACDALNVLGPHIEPRATRHIPEMIEMIRRLLERGYAYRAGGDVYFEVTSLPGYGRLSGRVLHELQAGARVEPGEFKRNPADFVLWKGAKPGEPSWDSPWGKGRPGWHIECSAMSLKYLGMGFDIHGGGNDLIFPHHENEIAQSEAYAGSAPFARYWMHNAMVNVRGEKMSKSLKNYFSISEALARFPADVLRYALASVHYRKPIEMEETRFEDAARGLDRLRAALASADAAAGRAPHHAVQGNAAGMGASGGASAALHAATLQARAAFETAMDDDLNTSGGLAAVFDLAAEMNRVSDPVLKGSLDAAQAASGLREARAALLAMTGVLGLRLEAGMEDPAVTRRISTLAAALAREAGHLFVGAPGDTLPQVVSYILAGRERARASKEFSTADMIRRRLADAGILVEDLPTGPRWRLARDSRQPISDAGTRGS